MQCSLYTFTISAALPFGRLCYTKPDDAIGYAKHRSRSHDPVIRVYDDAGNVIDARGQGEVQGAITHHVLT